MKKLILVLALLLHSYWGVCQMSTRHSIKAGITRVLFGSGDLAGYNYYNEYNRSLNRYLTFAPSLHVGYGSGDSGYLRFTKASFSLDPNFFVSPMRFDRSKVRLGVGPSLRFISDSHPNGYGIYFRGAIPNLPPSFDYVIGPMTYSRPLNYWTIGYTVVLEGELNVSPRWNTGVRASFQNYTSGETVANIGFNVGYRF
jgi:hypothetical protein